MKVKAKKWNLEITRENGITYFQPFGSVPSELKKTIAHLAKLNVSPKMAANVIKTEFSASVVAVED